MRISTYARVTNLKYANFDWSSLAGSLGIKAGAALNAAKGALPTTAAGAAKLGAGIGAGVGAVNYLGSDDKSIGNLAGQVAGGAAIGGAAGYGGASLKNAYQARKAGQVGGQAMLAPAAISVPAPAVVNQPIQTNAPKQQAQLPPSPSGNIVPPTPQGTQSGESRPTNLTNPNPVGATTERISPKSQKKKPDELAKNEPQGSMRRRGKSEKSANPVNYGQAETSRNTSPFANFKVRRYNGFIY